MRVFKQLTLTDRIRIEKWLKDGLRVKEIADRLRVDPSTVYRELKRGSYDKLDGKTWKLIPTYSPDIAEQRYGSGKERSRCTLQRTLYSGQKNASTVRRGS